MSEQVFELASSRGGAKLVFEGTIPSDREAYTGYSVHVTLQGGGVTASDQVFDHMPQRWTELFTGLAAEWQGWEGPRELESLEGQLKLSCTCDKTGHVAIRVSLRGDFPGSDWCAEDTIFVEAGQLDGIAHRAGGYFGR